MRRMIFSTLFSALAMVVLPLTAATSQAHADIINWNLLYGDPDDVGDSLGNVITPPRYTVVPIQLDGDDQVQRARPKHHIYRHQAHWLLRGETRHRHPHEHSEYVHREIYRQERDERARGED
jgi:hypothetical protein